MMRSRIKNYNITKFYSLFDFVSNIFERIVTDVIRIMRCVVTSGDLIKTKILQKEKVEQCLALLDV
jgi:hypothetical protein